MFQGVVHVVFGKSNVHIDGTCGELDWQGQQLQHWNPSSQTLQRVAAGGSVHYAYLLRKALLGHSSLPGAEKHHIVTSWHAGSEKSTPLFLYARCPACNIALELYLRTKESKERSQVAGVCEDDAVSKLRLSDFTKWNLLACAILCLWLVGKRMTELWTAFVKMLRRRNLSEICSCLMASGHRFVGVGYIHFTVLLWQYSHHYHFPWSIFIVIICYHPLLVGHAELYTPLFILFESWPSMSHQPTLRMVT